MECAQGSRHELNYIAQTVFGETPATPVFKSFRNTGTTLELSKTSIVSEELRSDEQISDFRGGNRQVGGDISMELSADSFDDMLEAALGGTWATDILKAGTTKRSFTLERKFADITQYLRYTGMVVSGMALSVQPDTMVTGSFTFIGKNQESDTVIVTGATYGSPTTTTPFDSFSGTITEGGVAIATVTGIDLTLDRGSEASFVIGDPTTPCITNGKSNLTGTLTAQFNDAVMLTKFIDETESSLTFSLTDGTKTQTYNIPRIKYTGGSVQVSNDGFVAISLPFQALLDSTEDSNIKITRS